MSQALRKTIVFIAAVIFMVLYLNSTKDKKRDYVSLSSANYISSDIS